MSQAIKDATDNIFRQTRFLLDRLRGSNRAEQQSCAEILKAVKTIRDELDPPRPGVERSDTLDFIRCRGCGFIVPMRKDDGKWRLTDHATDGRPFKAEKALGGNHSRCVRSGDVATGLPEKELTHPMDWAPETVSEAAAYQLPEAEADAMRTGDPADARGDEYDSFSA